VGSIMERVEGKEGFAEIKDGSARRHLCGGSEVVRRDLAR
jgi:hypothetical protein